jgi:hypothetical protein
MLVYASAIHFQTNDIAKRRLASIFLVDEVVA